MTTIDVVVWAGLLIAGVAQALFYGASWRRVARALAEAERTSAPEAAGAPQAARRPPRSPATPSHTPTGRLLHEQAAR